MVKREQKTRLAWRASLLPSTEGAGRPSVCARVALGCVAIMGHGKGKVTGRDVAKMGGMAEMIAALVKRIGEGNSEIKETSVAALKNIATQNHGEHTEALYKAGAVKPLVTLLVNGSADAQHNACGALAAIAAGKPDVQIAIVEGGGVPPIVKLLRMGGAAVQEQVRAVAKQTSIRCFLPHARFLAHASND